jgi:hypothetical protein
MGCFLRAVGEAVNFWWPDAPNSVKRSHRSPPVQSRLAGKHMNKSILSQFWRPACGSFRWL